MKLEEYVTIDPYIKFKQSADDEYREFKSKLKADLLLAGGPFDEPNYRSLVQGYQHFLNKDGDELFFACAVDPKHGHELKPLMKAMAKFILSGPHRLTADESKMLEDPSRVIDRAYDLFDKDQLDDIAFRLENIRDRVDGWLDELWRTVANKQKRVLRPGDTKPMSFEEWMDRPSVDQTLKLHQDSVLSDFFGTTEYEPPERQPWQSHATYMHNRWAVKLGFQAKDDTHLRVAYHAAQFLQQYGRELQSNETGLDDRRMLRFGLQRLSMGGSFVERVREALDQGELILRKAGMQHAANYFAEHIRSDWHHVKSELQSGRSME